MVAEDGLVLCDAVPVLCEDVPVMYEDVLVICDAGLVDLPLLTGAG
jgi:hypothetical protein